MREPYVPSPFDVGNAMFYGKTALRAVRAHRDAKRNIPFARGLAHMLEGRLMSVWGNDPRIM